jgi:opacity protein-like surface antigen
LKKTFASLALALATLATATAASATTLGLDYGYLRSTDGSYLAAHAAVASAKQSFKFGDVKFGVGTVQGVTNSRDNGNVFGVEYSYDFATPIGQLSPAVQAFRITGTSAVNDTVALGATLRTPVTAGTRLVTTVNHTELVSGGTSRTTSGGVGAELDVSKAITLKAGYVYTRLHTTERNANGLAVGVDYKF